MLAAATLACARVSKMHEFSDVDCRAVNALTSNTATNVLSRLKHRRQCQEQACTPVTCYQLERETM